jgi:hypothetical protein
MAEPDSEDLECLVVRLQRMDVNGERLEAKVEASEEKLEANGEEMRANQESMEMKVQADQELTKPTTSASKDNIRTDRGAIAQANSSQEGKRASKNVIRFVPMGSKEIVSSCMEGLLASVDRWKRSLHEEISCKLRHVESMIEDASRELEARRAEVGSVSCRSGGQRPGTCVYRARLPMHRRWARTAYNRRERQLCLECGSVGHLRRHCCRRRFELPFSEK